MADEFWDIERTTPYGTLPSFRHRAVDAIAASIVEYGITEPLLVDANGVIVLGHIRLAAAKKLGLSEVPVRIANDLIPDQVQAYRLSDIHGKR